jgi:hypothetical protein
MTEKQLIEIFEDFGSLEQGVFSFADFLKTLKSETADELLRLLKEKQ